MPATTTRRAAAAVAALLVTPALALAADAGGTKNVMEPDLVNSVVTLIVFGALLAVLYKFAWGPILVGLKAREDAQYAAIEEAKKARDEAAAMRAQVQAELAKAADQVRAMLDEARNDASALRATEREAGVKEAAAERERAKREIEVAKDTALDEIYRTAVDLATSLSAKTLGRQISADDHRKLLDESLVELRQSARSA
ncbi:F0F1 ATP synthase subunit B family protein [Urbifossiella limnaea]|uniref:ATP synthase subunit b n=1 Tax=Urbifossiella limnaea TaxID=2528023 RepID=A0A517Y2K7_9BACT|nr:ATP synthase F0 subunit B [Urbifossiella limnaea]QDU24001.1 ATP synthase subunit b [Urbifossiella limnaea]